MQTRKRLSVVAVLVGVVALAAACDPGWVNPSLGTGDGSGTVPGAVGAPAVNVAVGDPESTVDLGTRGVSDL